MTDGGAGGRTDGGAGMLTDRAIVVGWLDEDECYIPGHIFLFCPPFSFPDHVTFPSLIT